MSSQVFEQFMLSKNIFLLVLYQGTCTVQGAGKLNLLLPFLFLFLVQKLFLAGGYGEQSTVIIAEEDVEEGRSPSGRISPLPPFSFFFFFLREREI